MQTLWSFIKVTKTKTAINRIVIAYTADFVIWFIKTTTSSSYRIFLKVYWFIMLQYFLTQVFRYFSRKLKREITLAFRGIKGRQLSEFLWPRPLSNEWPVVRAYHWVGRHELAMARAREETHAVPSIIFPVVQIFLPQPCIYEWPIQANFVFINGKTYWSLWVNHYCTTS